MLTVLKSFLSHLVTEESDKLKVLGFEKLNVKDLMSNNLFHTLNMDTQIALQRRALLHQVINFIEHIPDFVTDSAATNDQKLEQIVHEFWDEYTLWLGKNEKDYPVDTILTHYFEMQPKDTPKKVDDNNLFQTITGILLQRYALSEHNLLG